MPDDLVVPTMPKLAEVGDSGLRRFSGTITEEFLAELKGARGQRTLVEMRDNHPVIGAVLFAITMLMRGVNWRVEPGSDSAADAKAADFVQSCLHDMSGSWNDTVQEILSFLAFGWSYHEIVMKMRVGPEETDGTKRSRFTDRKIGWRKFPLRAQETLLRWELDETGGVQAMTQQPPTGGIRTIPIERALLFRAGFVKGNPEGRSVLRNAAISYLMQKKLLEIEAIGIERDLAGLPVITAPKRIFESHASADDRTLLAALQDMVRSIRRDEGHGVVLPMEHKDGTPLYDLKLLSTGGGRQIDTNAVIQRYDGRIAMTVLADFVLLGHQQVGTFSLSSDKSSMFAVAIGAFLDHIADVMNRHAIPRLLRMNGMPVKELPMLKHDDIEKPDVEALGRFVNAMVGSGVIVPDMPLEATMRDLAGLPPADEKTRMVDSAEGKDEEIAAPGKGKPEGESEEDDDDEAEPKPKRGQPADREGKKPPVSRETPAPERESDD